MLSPSAHYEPMENDDKIAHLQVIDPMENTVAEAIVEILKENSGEQVSMPLTSLGKKISTKFGKPFSNLVPTQKLVPFIRNNLSDRVTLLGPTHNIHAKLATEMESGDTSRRILFDRIFWTAFFKGFAHEEKRYLKITRPFEFAREKFDEDWIEIEKIFSDDESIAPEDRKDRAHAAIRDWCARHKFSLEDFRQINQYQNHSQDRRPRESLEKDSLLEEIFSQKKLQSRNFAGIVALKNLIDTIPENERHKHSINLDLIYTLINATGK